MAETVVTSQPLLPEVSNPEVMRSFGADMILLNMFDDMNPVVNGITNRSASRHYLEPVDPNSIS
jgi:hypothetical protein